MPPCGAARTGPGSVGPDLGKELKPAFSGRQLAKYALAAGMSEFIGGRPQSSPERRIALIVSGV
jgi:hypothetical protein